MAPGSSRDLLYVRRRDGRDTRTVKLVHSVEYEAPDVEIEPHTDCV